MNANAIKKKQIKERLNSYRGTIISDATVIESALGWKLRRLFFPKTNWRASIFYYEIIDAFNFDKKISLYEKIPTFKKTKRYTKIKKSLRFIQQLRNAVAHWQLDEKMSNKNEIVIYRMTPFQRKKLTDKLMEEFREHKKFLLKVFGWEQTLKEKYGD